MIGSLLILYILFAAIMAGLYGASNKDTPRTLGYYLVSIVVIILWPLFLMYGIGMAIGEAVNSTAFDGLP